MINFSKCSSNPASSYSILFQSEICQKDYGNKMCWRSSYSSWSCDFSIPTKREFRASSAPLIPNPFPELCNPTHSPVLTGSFSGRDPPSNSSTHVSMHSLICYTNDRQLPVALWILSSYNRWQTPWQATLRGKTSVHVHKHITGQSVHRLNKNTQHKHILWHLKKVHDLKQTKHCMHLHAS